MGPDDVRRGVDGGWSVVVGELVVVLLPDCLKKVLGLVPCLGKLKTREI